MEVKEWRKLYGQFVCLSVTFFCSSYLFCISSLLQILLILIYLSFFLFALNRSLLSLTSCFSLDLVQHLLVSFALLYFVFYIWSKLLFLIYFSNCLNCSPSFDSSVFFFILYGSILKRMFLFGLLKVFLAFMSSPLGLWSPQTTRFASFFLFYLSFLN